MNKLGFLTSATLALGFSALVGCGADAPTATASGVFPESGLLGRKLRVEVTGDVTNWSDKSTVSFGSGVTVDSVAVASPTDLVASITIMDTATPGLTDVTVTDGGKTFTLKQAFELQPAISLQMNGTLAQGSVGFFTITNKDFDNPFDTTSTGDGFFTPLVFTNLQIDAPAGVTMQVGGATAFSITGTAFIDVDASAGGPVTLTSGPAGGTTIVSALGTDLAVMPRTAVALTSGTAASGTVTNPDDSTLYTFTPATTPSLNAFSATSTSTSASPAVAILPASGHWSDLISATATGSTVSRSAADKFYAVYIDTSGASGYPFQVTATSTVMTTANETETNDTGAAAQGPFTPPFLLDNGSLSSLTDQDWIKVTVPAGKKIHIKTYGDPQTDTLIDVFGPNSAAAPFPATPAGANESADTGYQEDFTTPATTVGGTYFIEISASQQGFFDPAHNTYYATVVLE